MYREIKVMQILKNGPYILPILDMVRDEESGSPKIVTKWISTLPYRVIFGYSFHSRSFTPVLLIMSSDTICIRC